MSEGTLSKLKEAFDKGYKAFSACDEHRKMVSANPYKINSILAKEWDRGFNRAYAEVAGTIKSPEEYKKMGYIPKERIKT